MKKNILIFSHAMEIGGAERALLGLLENINYNEYDVDLFLMRQEGELFKYIPKEVNILPEISEYSCLAVPIINILKKGRTKIAYGRLKGKNLAKQRVNDLKLQADNQVAIEYSHKYTKKYMPRINDKQYDVAVSFLTPHYFVQEKVNAKYKVAWIHTDYSKVAVDVESESKMWNAYDRIISISDAVTESFVKVFPETANKITVIENMMAEKTIMSQKEEFEVKDEMPDDGNIKILSIGRFCHAKNFDNVPDICSRILKSGLKVKWYLIGFGGSEQLIRDKIEEAGMQKNVIILGKKENPYPYIKECDVYIQPSRYEGNAVTVHEAQLLGKPVIITNYPTAKSQIQDGVDGYIVPMEKEVCSKKISDILNKGEIFKSV